MSLHLRGPFEDCEDEWLRWTDGQGVLIPPGKESILAGQPQAAREQQRADHSERFLVAERQRAARLAELLRQAGIDPEQR